MFASMANQSAGRDGRTFLVYRRPSGVTYLAFKQFFGSEDDARGPPHKQLREEHGIHPLTVLAGGASERKGNCVQVKWSSGQGNLGSDVKTQINHMKADRKLSEDEAKDFRGLLVRLLPKASAEICSIIDSKWDESDGKGSMQEFILTDLCVREIDAAINSKIKQIQSNTSLNPYRYTIEWLQNECAVEFDGRGPGGGLTVCQLQEIAQARSGDFGVETLDFRYCDESDAGSAAVLQLLQRCPKLEDLRFMGCSVTGDNLQKLLLKVPCTLEFLRIVDNDELEDLPDNWSRLRDLDELTLPSHLETCALPGSVQRLVDNGNLELRFE